MNHVLKIKAPSSCTIKPGNSKSDFPYYIEISNYQILPDLEIRFMDLHGIPICSLSLSKEDSLSLAQGIIQLHYQTASEHDQAIAFSELLKEGYLKP